jgi:AraC-like DNA-binding protein
VLGYLVLASDNLAEAVYTYQRYERLFYGVDMAEVVLHQDEVEIRWSRGDTTGVMADETAIAALVTFLHKQIDNPPPPSRVGFVHEAPPARAQACEAFFGCSVDFGASHTLVRFPIAYMSIPMPHREPGLRALLNRQAKALLDALPDPNAFDKAVQQLLVRLLPDGEVSVDKVAQAMNQSTRTLQRRLTESGMTWQYLLDRTREQLARQYLSDRALSLAEIALLLGYSEQSAFTRAFKRWTGLTPLAFRTQTGQI